ncbi:hypothetical protein [Kaistella palustris]|uniref:hypothetical protein n=1 Tax=Kaistella palustris TaxID=493376 RepID=UPI000420C65F|nr:hypothetical protein [Kaistella palustris]
MKKLLLLTVLSPLFSFAQDISLNLKRDMYPLYIINGIISNEVQSKLLKPTDISSVSIYKSDSLPENLTSFKNFASDGIVEISLKEKEENPTVSLAHLNKKNSLDEINPVYINGTLLLNTDTKVLEEAIIKTEVIENKGQKFLNIWTVAPKSSKAVS